MKNHKEKAERALRTARNKIDLVLREYYKNGHWLHTVIIEKAMRHLNTAYNAAVLADEEDMEACFSELDNGGSEPDKVVKWN